MRRRTFALGLPLGLAALSACTGDGPGSSPASDAGQAVETAGAAPVDPEPTVIGELADAVDVTELRLPLSMTVMIVVDPGWTSTPLELDGFFLGYDDRGQTLRFIAAKEDGTLLWEAHRPLSCTGFALSRGAEEQPIAVLPDAEARTDAMPVTTLTGYDLETAEQLWGPFKVPGPQAAPGLVFAAPGDEPMGESGPRVALDAATGEVALDSQAADVGVILAEHQGSIIFTEGSAADLVAINASDANELWRLALPAGIDAERVRIVGGIDPISHLAVLGDGQEPGVVLDVQAGRVIAEGAGRIAHDHSLEITVISSGTTLRGVDADGQENWSHEDPEALQLIAAGEWLAYAIRPQEGTLVVLDAAQGTMVQPYDQDLKGPLAIPEVFSAQTAAVVDLDGPRFLVTTTLDEDYGLRE